MDQTHIEGDEVVYFCNNTGTLQYEKQEGMAEVKLDRPLRSMNIEEIKEAIKDSVDKFLCK